MINEKEVDYSINVIQADIQYFIRYKNQLKKFCIDNRVVITKVNMNKIFIEIETINNHIQNLKNQEQELLKLLDKFYYGNNSNT
jgi:hypothetical protein